MKIQFENDLCMTIVDEGFETLDQFQWLRQEGCDVTKGFVVAPTISYINLERWIGEGRPSLLSTLDQ